MTPSIIELATLRLKARRLNQPRHRVPRKMKVNPTKLFTSDHK